MSDVLYEVNDLKKVFVTKRDWKGQPLRTVKACDGVSFSLRQGETLGVVGESGCGKSTLGRLLMKLQDPTEGRLVFDGHDITALSPGQMRPYRRNMQMIFQDPYASLNPRYTIFAYVKEPLDVFDIGAPQERRRMVEELLEYVGIPGENVYRYPHELSGGQRQRAVIARAVISDPKLIVCDEPVSALDVSVRAQVLNLMRRLQRERGLTYLFISHDISVIRYLSNRIMVMYLGRIVELGEKTDVLDRPLHPYTKGLLSSVPVPDVHREHTFTRLEGEPPSPIDPPAGCGFCTRCPYAKEICASRRPELRDFGNGHLAACHLLG